MRKHRNPQQENIFIEFMQNNQDVARGYVKGDRVAKELLWESLTLKLNSCGPPSKDCQGWKKTWTDWKAYVNNKLSHNKREINKTGGGQFNKFILSDVEESVAALSGIYRSVEGIVGAKDFADSDLVILMDSDEENKTSIAKPVRTVAQRAGKDLETINDTFHSNMPQLSCAPSTSKDALMDIEAEKSFESSSHLDLIFSDKTCNIDSEQNPSGKNNTTSARKRLCSTPSPNLNKKPRTCTPKTAPQHDLHNLLFDENKHLKSIVKLMEEQREEFKSQNRKLGRL